MNNNTLKYLFAVFLPLIVGQLLVSCKQGNPEVSASLDRIEQVVGQHPDSALAELVRLDSLLDAGAVRIEGDRQMARYALLKTQTHDKNWIDDTNDSLILRAVRYYDEHGSKREQMLAHFYHGAIFRNAKDYGAAFVAYRQAESLALDSEDYHYLSLIYGNLSALCYDTYSNDVFSYGHNSLKYARLSSNTRQTFSIRADLARSYSARLLYDTAEIWFRQVLDSLPSNDPIVQRCLTSYIEQCVNTEKYHLADSLICLLNPITQPVDLLNKACLFQIKGDQDSEKYYIQLAEQNIKYPEQRVFYYEKMSWIAEMKGDYASAFSFEKKRLYEQNKIITDIYSKSVSNYQRNYEVQQKTLVQYRYTAYRLRTMLVVVFILILFSIMCGYLYRKLKTQNQELEEAIKKIFNQSILLKSRATTLGEQRIQIEELEQLLHEARGDNISRRMTRLFARHFNLYNRLGYVLYKTQDTPSQHRTIYELVDKEVKRLCSDKKIITKVDRMIDDSFDGAITKVKDMASELTDDDIRLARFMLMNLSSRTIAYLLNIDPMAVYKRKSRLKEKLKLKESQYAKDILALIYDFGEGEKQEKE